MSIYTVSQVNSYIQRMFCEDFLLQKITVRGEVSGCKYHPSGHIYFNLKDEGSVLACVMFRQHAVKLGQRLEDGKQYRFTGSVRAYEKAGRYQLYAEKVEDDGQGALYEKFEALKKKLMESGMFDASYKQPIPKYVRKLGVVTASSGAAVRDIIDIAGRRNPYVQIYLYPATVQGETAADSIAAGIEMLAEMKVDCMIVGRGGGSIEDLWAFNEEKVAEAIFNCPVPVISAVGHETDVTIADFVADLRAPTPSAAAELAVFEYVRLAEELADMEELLLERMQDVLEDRRDRLERYKKDLDHASPASKLKEQRMRLLRLRDGLSTRMDRRLTAARSRLDVNIGRMEGASPLKRLESGFSHVSDAGGRTVKSVEGVSPGDRLTVAVKDGYIDAKVENVRKVNLADREDSGDGS